LIAVWCVLAVCRLVVSWWLDIASISLLVAVVAGWFCFSLGVCSSGETSLGFLSW